MNACPSDQELNRFLRKELANDADSSIADHLANCPSCENRLAALAEGDAALLGHLRDRQNALQDVASTTELAILAEVTKPKREGFSKSRIGPYELLETLGEGGLGTVYLAQQHEPIRRRVALKVIKAGMDTKQVVARFEAERQALAVMDHPHVAKVFDGGATTEGRPYFVMELVAGEPITVYCDRNKLSMQERLELFIGVCEAVQHAHQKGIIHRDLKPSNVLVTVKEGTPVPKVIDFGIAKAINQRLTEKTVFTEQGLLIGTPEYMSPEQAEMGATDVDTRTDIYSLGVLLYELLTGTLPFDSKTLRRAGYGEIQRIIRDVEPPRPSTRLSSLSDGATKLLFSAGKPRYVGKERVAAGAPGARDASSSDKPPERMGSPAPRPNKEDDTSLAAVAARRGCDPKTLLKSIRGDLDWIVMKCLEKDRTRRYETANGLALEIRRYKKNEPILAVPPSALYRIQKFVRRNRGPVIGAAVFMLLITVAISGLTGLYFRAVAAETQERQARKQAVAQRERAEAVNDFVMRAMISSDPNQGGAQGFLVTEALERAILQLDAGSLKEQPETEADLRLTISRIFNGNGRSKEALRLAERALDLNRSLHPGDDMAVAECLNELGICLHSLGRSTEALPKFADSVEMYQRLSTGDDPAVAGVLDNTAGCLGALGRWNKALPMYERAMEIRQRVFKGDHPDMAEGLNAMAVCLMELGRSADALPILRTAIEMNQRLFNGDHPNLASCLNNLAACQRSLGQDVQALSDYEAALKMYQRLFKGDHPAVAIGLNNVAIYLDSLGRSAEALPKYRQSLAMRQRLFAGDHPDVAGSLGNLASCLNSLGRYSEALQEYEAALQMNQRLFKGDHPDVAWSLNNVAYCLQSLGRLHESLPKYQASLQMYQRLFDDDHPMVARALNNVASCLDVLGQPAEALPQYEAALAMNQRLFKGDHSDVAMGFNNLAYCLDSLGRTAEALPKYEAALEMYVRLNKGDHPDVAMALNNVGACQQSMGHSAQALPKIEAALAMYQRILLPDHPNILIVENRLGKLFTDLKRFDEAEPRLLKVQAAMSTTLDISPTLKQGNTEALIKFYDARHAAEPTKGYDQKAADWREKLRALEATTQPTAVSSSSTQPAIFRSGIAKSKLSSCISFESQELRLACQLTLTKKNVGICWRRTRLPGIPYGVVLTVCDSFWPA